MDTVRFRLSQCLGNMLGELVQVIYFVHVARVTHLERSPWLQVLHRHAKSGKIVLGGIIHIGKSLEDVLGHDTVCSTVTSIHMGNVKCHLKCF